MMNVQVINRQIWKINRAMNKSGDGQKAISRMLDIKPITKAVKKTMALQHIKLEAGKYYSDWGSGTKKLVDPNNVILVMVDLERQMQVPHQNWVF